MRIALFGGGGFVGRHLAAELARRGHSLAIPVRNRERVKESLILLPNADVFGYDPNAVLSLKKGLTGADAVVNLVGILNENGRNLYERAHGEFVRMLAEGCVKNRVGRFVQLSAIGASPGAPSAYLRSKAKGEQIIKSTDAVTHLIVRPSVVFGRGDSFVNRFAGLIRTLPVMPLPMAAAEFQPVFVGDLARMIADVLEDDSYHNRIFHVGGPEVMTLEAVIRRIAAALGRPGRVVGLGRGMSHFFAAVAEKTPFVDLITRDNCYSMQLPSVCPKDGNDLLKILGEATSFDSGLAMMFARGENYGHLRAEARRR